MTNTERDFYDALSDDISELKEHKEDIDSEAARLEAVVEQVDNQLETLHVECCDVESDIAWLKQSKESKLSHSNLSQDEDLRKTILEETKAIDALVQKRQTLVNKIKEKIVFYNHKRKIYQDDIVRQERKIELIDMKIESPEDMVPPCPEDAEGCALITTYFPAASSSCIVHNFQRMDVS